VHARHHLCSAKLILPQRDRGTDRPPQCILASNRRRDGYSRLRILHSQPSVHRHCAVSVLDKRRLINIKVERGIKAGKRACILSCRAANTSGTVPCCETGQLLAGVSALDCASIRAAIACIGIPVFALLTTNLLAVATLRIASRLLAGCVHTDPTILLGRTVSATTVTVLGVPVVARLVRSLVQPN